MKRWISEQKQFELSYSLQKSLPVREPVEDLCTGLSLQLHFLMVYAVNSILSILGYLDFSPLDFFFFSESSRVRRLCNSCILATAALRILLFPEASNKSYQPPFLLITKDSTAFHSSALCLSLNKTMIDVFYHYMLTYLLG